MSGGTWGYQSYKLEELAENLSSNEIVQLLKAVAQTEHIVDWAESCDTSRERAEPQLYDLWVKTFNEVYGEHLWPISFWRLR